MGGMKDVMIKQQEDHAMATSHLVQKGILQKFEYHGEVFGGGRDLEDDFWRNAMADRNRGGNGPVPWAASMEAREYTELLKAAYENHFGDGCGYCTKHEAE